MKHRKNYRETNRKLVQAIREEKEGGRDVLAGRVARRAGVSKDTVVYHGGVWGTVWSEIDLCMQEVREGWTEVPTRVMMKNLVAILAREQDLMKIEIMEKSYALTEAIFVILCEKKGPVRVARFEEMVMVADVVVRKFAKRDLRKTAVREELVERLMEVWRKYVKTV